MKPLLLIIATILVSYIMVIFALDIEILKRKNEILQFRAEFSSLNQRLHQKFEEQYFYSQSEIRYVSINAILKANIAYYDSQKTTVSVLNLTNILIEFIEQIEQEEKWIISEKLKNL